MVKHRRLFPEYLTAKAHNTKGLCRHILASAVALCCVLLLTLSADAQLQHRWSFTSDATDSVGSADWTLEGNANVTGGQLVLDGDTTNGLTRAVQDGSTIGINTYPAVTLEAWATPDPVMTGFTTLAGFGNDPPDDPTGNDVPSEYLIMQTHRGDDASSLAISLGNDADPWTEEDFARGPELNDDAEHHYVGVLTNEAITLYVDGAFAATNPVGAANGGNAADNMISGLSNAEAWIGYAYGVDPLWIGEVNEYRIFNEAASPNYITRSNEAGPDELVSFAPVFDLSLVVNKSTGEATIQNVSNDPVTFNYYLTESEAGALDPTDGSGWNSLDDQNFDAGLASDFDDSGVVDGTDLAAWEGAYGTSDAGDTDGDGDSDGSDFLAWQRQFGQSPGAGDSWDEAGGSNSNMLAELFLNGATTLGPGESVSIGNAYDSSVFGSADGDLSFTYGTPGGAFLVEGDVQYLSSLSAVPEPTTLACVLSSIAMPLFWGRPRRVLAVN